ncbi:hypothetical protein PUN28_003510 [Cardiocondyla obscurior]|uniref:Uncharacterized protein n=1 Tax=Cardiocondyla obscurior TaxID=286306 RepID=A0AAW2GKT0_9HYME
MTLTSIHARESAVGARRRKSRSGDLNLFLHGETAAAAASRGLPQRHRPAARILALSCGAPVGKLIKPQQRGKEPRVSPAADRDYLYDLPPRNQFRTIRFVVKRYVAPQSQKDTERMVLHARLALGARTLLFRASFPHIGEILENTKRESTQKTKKKKKKKDKILSSKK